MIEGTRFRRTMGHFATGVAVATTRRADGSEVGLTCNSIASVSLSPPLVLFCVDHEARSRPAFLEAGHFSLSLLGRGQEELSRRFASADSAERFDGVSTRDGVTGAPVLDGAVASLDCTLWKTVEAGDHTILIGQVEAAVAEGDPDPLLYFRGRYGSIAP
jgi:3-hydroxy-9,10-secoandrosta-1,3,5(10)-triene-9,17-dione monooxygenase reductase component